MGSNPGIPSLLSAWLACPWRLHRAANTHNMPGIAIVICLAPVPVPRFLIQCRRCHTRVMTQPPHTHHRGVHRSSCHRTSHCATCACTVAGGCVPWAQAGRWRVWHCLPGQFQGEGRIQHSHHPEKGGSSRGKHAPSLMPAAGPVGNPAPGCHRSPCTHVQKHLCLLFFTKCLLCRKAKQSFGEQGEASPSFHEPQFLIESSEEQYNTHAFFHALS